MRIHLKAVQRVRVQLRELRRLRRLRLLTLSTLLLLLLSLPLSGGAIERSERRGRAWPKRRRMGRGRKGRRLERWRWLCTGW